MDGKTGQRYQVTIPPETAKELRKQGNGSLSGAIRLAPWVMHRRFMKETIRKNKQQIVLLESGKMRPGYGPEAATQAGADAEAARLRKKTEELEVLLRQELVWERRQNALFAVNRQFLPHGNGQPDTASLDALDAAEAEWREVEGEAQHIVDEIRKGVR